MTAGHLAAGGALAALLALGAAMGAQAKGVALIVGVSDYGSRSLNLHGPVNDAEALRDVLVRRWGFAADDVRVLTDARATKPAILAELRALRERSSAGDDVVIYLSGHGTSALDGTARLPVPHGSGAFIPYGFDPSTPERTAATLLVGRTDLRPLLEALDQAGRNVWVINDACYAGNAVRSVAQPTSSELREKMIPLPDTRSQRDREKDEAMARNRPGLEPYPYKRIAYLSASAEGERARDIPRDALARYPTLDGKPHGAMTDALLRVLDGQWPADLNRDGLLDLNEVHRAVGSFMAQRAYGHTPQRLPAVAEDLGGLGTRPVLKARGVAVQPAQAAPQPLTVRVDPALPSGVGAAVGAAPDVRLAPAGPADIHLLARGDKLIVASMGGDLIAEAPSTDIARLQAQVRQLAFAKRLRLLGERHQRGALAFDLAPAEFGGNLRVGQFVHFVVRPDRPAWVVIVNINSDGKVTVLFPYHANELSPVQAGAARAIPGDSGSDRIQVEPPEGMDLQLAFAFDTRPEGLDKLLGVANVEASDGRLAILENMLAQQNGKFTFGHSALRVSAALKP